MRARSIALLILMIGCGVMSWEWVFANPATTETWNVKLRKQVPNEAGEYRPVEQSVNWDAARTAIIIIDMWNNHSCKSAAERVAEMAPHMNGVLRAARSKGMLIIHAPSGCMDAYRGAPARQRAQDAPFAAATVKFQWNYFKWMTPAICLFRRQSTIGRFSPKTTWKTRVSALPPSAIRGFTSAPAPRSTASASRSDTKICAGTQ